MGFLLTPLAAHAQYPGGGSGGGYPGGGGGYPGGGSGGGTGSFTVTYTNNGTFSYTSPSAMPPNQSGNWPDANNGDSLSGSDTRNGNIQGKVTATLTWVPASGQTMQSDPPPTSVSVIEYANAYERSLWGNDPAPAPGPSGTVSDGLGDTPVANGLGYTASGYLVTQLSVSSGSATVSCSLSAQNPTYSQSNGYPPYSHWPGGQTAVSFSVTPCPTTVTLIGTTKGSSNQDDILIGQTCIASLSINNQPSWMTMDPPQWSISGDVFTSFNISSDQSTGVAIPYPDPSRSGNPPIQPWFYWKSTGANSGSTSKTISATATVRDSSGNSLGTVTGTKTINVWVPDRYDTPLGFNGNYAVNPELGTVGINTSTSEVVSNDPSGNSGGYDLRVAVSTPDLFTSGGTTFGDWAWLQLCQINVQGGNNTQMANPELDSSFPYNTGGAAGNGTPGTPLSANKVANKPVYNLFSDSPTEGWNNYFLHFDTTFAFNNHFNLYVMYQPPDTGYGVNWVPISLYQWGFSASMTRPGLNSTWTPNPPGSVANYGRSDFPSYPSWTSKFSP